MRGFLKSWSLGPLSLLFGLAGSFSIKADCLDITQKLGLREFLESTAHEAIISRSRGKEGSAAPVVQKITPQNIGRIFRHQYNPTSPHILGAKALAFFWTHHAHSIFWQTGEGLEGLNIHHRDALSQLREWEHNDLVKLRAGLDEIFDLLPSLIRDPRMLEEAERTFMMFRTGEHAWPDVDIDVYREWAEALRDVRTHHSFQYADLAANIGFQLSARPDPNGHLGVFRFDIDSSLLSASQHRRVNYGYWPFLVRFAHEAVDPTLRRYSFIGLRRGANVPTPVIDDIADLVQMPVRRVE